MENHSITFLNNAFQLSGPEVCEGIVVIFITKVAVTKLALRGTREERPRLDDQNPTYLHSGWIYLLGCKHTNAPANDNNIPCLDGGVEWRDVCDVPGISAAGGGGLQEAWMRTSMRPAGDRRSARGSLRTCRGMLYLGIEIFHLGHTCGGGVANRGPGRGDGSDRDRGVVGRTMSNREI